MVTYRHNYYIGHLSNRDSLTIAEIFLQNVSTFTATFITSNSVSAYVVTWETAVTLINVCTVN